MGDAENALQSSKKRAAGRELTRDTPIDDEEDDTDFEAGTFKKASEEVLATRRMVKVVRRQQKSAPNPFAGIRLPAPTESTAKSGEATSETQPEKAKDEETKQPEIKAPEVEDKSTSNNDVADRNNAGKDLAEKETDSDNSKVDNEQSKDGSKIENEDKKEVADKESAGEINKEPPTEEKNTENSDKNGNSESKDKEDKVSDEPTAEGGPFKSFQQLSSNQNAFTGLAGSGFSSSLFSFGSTTNDGSALGSGSSSIFGLKPDQPLGLGLSNAGSSGFGTSGASAVSKTETLQEVVVETGEENEEVVFNADSVLFEFADGGWKERGKGEVKVNVTSGTEKKARVLMRSKGNYRLILNARLYPEMKLTNMEKKGVTFACATEGKDRLSTFALKFKDGSIVEDFKTAITAHKGEASTIVKTPENSPKASDV
ncbi:nuclear pore complex protein NUP50A isoform X2 [Medicago truncatula]|uniref:nuclear pore complex protein NUP50A isoform X2 n=1 Tax=Medicago truncatula TaxID=3880 RepID=UPI001968600E|nr:nuclear pore complex protein NUP50A isoform X2 [Medicago truncatula]